MPYASETSSMVDVEPAHEVGEVAEVGLGGGEQELVVGVPEDDAVLEDEARGRRTRRCTAPGPGGTCRTSRASTPARNRSASRPAIRYLYSGEVSKKPAALRTAKYSCLADMSYFCAER